MSLLRNNKAVLLLTAGVIAIVIIGMAALLPAQTGGNKPDTNVKVDEFYPQGVVDKPTNITAKFSNNLVSDSSINQIVFDIPLQFEPPISGITRWIDNDELRFFPDSMFAPSTEYKVTVKSDKRYEYGNRINEKRTFEFRTPIFIVDNIRTETINVPEDNHQNQLLIHIVFNYDVDYNELLNHIESNLKYKGRVIKFEALKPQSSKGFTLISDPFAPKEVNGQFEFIITKGLNCIGGQIPLQADFRREIYIPKPQRLVIEHVSPITSGKSGQIMITFSQSMSQRDIEEYISLIPKVNFTASQEYRRIHIFGDFKPGEIYTLNIRQGLTSLNGQILESDYSSQVQMPDLEPSLKFADEGFYLSKESDKLLGIETINVNDISVEVEQVFPNNIVYYLGNHDYYYYGHNAENYGRKIFSKEYGLPSVLNEPLNSTFDLGDIVGDTLEGIYVVSVRNKDKRWDYTQRRIMITDLGIMARISDNYLMVWVNSLAETEPVNRAHISLLSTNNQTLCEGYTNSKGIAIFEDIGEKLEGFEPFVITASKGKDLSYLKFSECLLPSAEFDITGRPFLTRGYESFIYSDRGVYRPGETVHLVNVVRGKDGVLPESFPLIMQISDPQGREFKKLKLSTENDGLESVDIDIPSFAKTGAYNTQVKIGDDIIGQYSFQVEEFMPDRIKTSVTTDKESYASGEQVEIKVNGEYLFGAPCDGNQVYGQVVIEPERFKSSSWPDFNFNATDRKFTNISANLEQTALNNQGSYTYYYDIPEYMTPPSALKAIISATVLESGGRGVSAYKAVMVHPYNSYVGIKSNYEGYAKVGEDVNYSVISVDKNGEAASDSIWVKFYRVIYHTIVKKDSRGIYRYVSEEEDHLIDSTLVKIANKPAIASFTPQDYGSYRIKAFSSSSDHYTSASFYASGWGYAPWSMTNPDRIELELDKDNYKAGETAKLLVKAPFEGKLLLNIEKDKVLESKTYTLDSNTAEIELKVKREYSPNVYLSATLIKSTRSLERFSPPRAFGLISLKADNTENKLAINIETPEEMRPNEKLTVKIKTEPKARLTVAAVDYGITQLTGFDTPNPFKFFFGQRRPSLRAYDIYSFIFPDIAPSQSMLSFGGDMITALDEYRQRHVSPLVSTRVKPVALWSGIVTADSIGNATATFDIPQFNGKLKVMAVGFNKEKCGSGKNDVFVKEKLIIQESLPRFMTFGDTIIAKLTVFNNTGADTKVDIGMVASGSAIIGSQNKVSELIPDGGKQTVDFTIIAKNNPGVAIFDINAWAGNEKAHAKVELPNRPPQPLVTKYGSGVVNDGQPIRISMPSDWLGGTDRYQLKLSSMPALRFNKSIQYLLRYPYGCLEQTTSRLFPLLYFNDIAKIAEPGVFGGKGHTYFINEGIIKLSGMQRNDGHFQYWPGHSSSFYYWTSIYASHFLVEARKAGYYVNDDVYKKMIKAMKKTANDAKLENNDGVLRIYASYVLAQAGELDNSTLSGLKYLNLVNLPTYSLFQYAGATAMVKGADEAMMILPSQIHPLKIEFETGGYFNSSIRANSILLEILSEIAPNNPSIPVLVEAITEDLYFDSWYTTQSTAWGLMALGKFLKTQVTPDYTGSIVVDGNSYKNFGVEELSYTDSLFAGKEIELSINGQGNCYYYWQASGVPNTGLIEEYDKRLETRREYLDTDGNPFDPASLKLGDQIVVKISARALDKNLENVVINDLLPSCIEIENPRLETTGKLNRKSFRQSSIDYMDIRDDRLLLFTGLRNGAEFNYYYLARVIATGDFLVPPVAAECMYDPTIRSAGSSGRISISPEK